MVSDTAAAAAPGPDTPHTGTTATPTTPDTAPTDNGLTALLTPVQPARLTLNPTNAGDTPSTAGTDTLTSVSSADYHAHNQDPTQTSNSTDTGVNGKTQQSILRAWMLAGAERWKKGADARNKALDIQKARAQALQVKESRTVNRSEKIVGGSTNSGTTSHNNAGKSLNNKTSNANKGAGTSKNDHNTTKNGPAGRHNSGPAGSGGSSSSGGAGRHGGGPSHGKQNTSRDRAKTNTNGPNSSKPPGSRKDPAKPSSTGGGKSPTGNGGGTGSTGSKGSGAGGVGSSNGRGPGGTGSPGGPRGSAGKDGKPGKDTPAHAPTTKTPKTVKDTAGNGKPDKHRKVDLEKKPARKDERTGATTGTAPTGKTTVGVKKTPGPTSPSGAGTGRPLNVQESREAGYRDGTRAATVAAHVEAWRDGVRDGWTDRKADAAREKARLDQAHTARTQPATAPQQKVPPMPTEPPTAHPGPQPIQVTAVTHTGVTLGAGADRSSISHGEVRSLKQFQRKLAAKTDTLARIAEGSRSLKAHAEEQLKHITHLTELARLSNAGDDLLSGLLKLEEAAKTQSMAADEIITRAVRGHEACTVLTGNTETRYGGIYKAVIDSGLIAPADLHYYKDSAHAV